MNQLQLFYYRNKQFYQIYPKQNRLTAHNIMLGPYEYKQNHLLGQGSTGKVYAGIDTRTNQKVAIKAIQLKIMSNDILKYLLNNEKIALEQIKSSNVLKLYDIIEDSNYCYIITQFCQGGSLADYIELKRRIPEKKAMTMLKKIANGLKAIHQKNIIHRDMKSQNVMLRNQDPVIIDFGYCEYLFGLKPLRRYNVGSPAYMSPQAYLHSKYSVKSDIWALGVIFHQMLTSEVLDEITPMKQFFDQMIKRGGVKLQHQFSRQVMKILSSIFHINPEKRASIGEIIRIIDECLGVHTDIYEQPRMKRGNSQYIKTTPYSFRNKDKNNHVRVDSKEKDTMNFIQSPTKLRKIINIPTEDRKVQTQLSISISSSPVRKYSQDYHFHKNSSREIYSPQINRYTQAQSEQIIHQRKPTIQLISLAPQYRQQTENVKHRQDIYQINRKFKQISNFFNEKNPQINSSQRAPKMHYQSSMDWKNRQTSGTKLDKKYNNVLKSNSQQKLNYTGLQRHSNYKNTSYNVNTIKFNKKQSQPNRYQHQYSSQRPQLQSFRNHIKYGDRFQGY